MAEISYHQFNLAVIAVMEARGGEVSMGELMEIEWEVLTAFLAAGLTVDNKWLT